ncbi:uncharacterized protein LOC109840258 isoform X2 [Asparagus officinalis]|uniref:uncharacterized protein LOC109840258 isoform X2 n=1 Tax=Asparagus officinalis TaxID=4686 RepID=UPI00098E1793|nr:uncharacterized protein LOC109840258 isoform X2 [Asparagus officinalis]
MVQLDFDSLREKDFAVDLESGNNAVTSEQGFTDSKRVWNDFASSEESNKNEEVVSSGNAYSKSVETPLENGEWASPLLEKPKKKNCKKPPKPPRPPRAPSMDAADQKFLMEMSEAAKLKRARIERMKALKRMKNAKSGSSGLFSGGGSRVKFHGSPESSAGARGGFISVQFYRNMSVDRDSNSASSSSASPNNVELISGLDDDGKARGDAGYAMRRLEGKEE